MRRASLRFYYATRTRSGMNGVNSFGREACRGKKLYESYLREANADKTIGNYIENFYFHMRSFGLVAVEEKLCRKVAQNLMSWKEQFFKSGRSQVINFIIFFSPDFNIPQKILFRNFFWNEQQFAPLQLHCSSQAASSIIQLTSSVNRSRLLLHVMRAQNWKVSHVKVGPSI